MGVVESSMKFDNEYCSKVKSVVEKFLLEHGMELSVDDKYTLHHAAIQSEGGIAVDDQHWLVFYKSSGIICEENCGLMIGKGRNWKVLPSQIDDLNSAVRQCLEGNQNRH